MSMADFSKIKELWNIVPKDEEMNLYVHSPFCNCKCKYCLYRGKLDHSKIEITYFIKTLKNSLYKSRDILQDRKVKTFYFGGGTPNVFTIDEIKNITNTVYSICTPQNKIIELNPFFLTKNYLEEICKLGYTLITFGAQSFDKETLDKHARPYVSPQKIKEYVDICKSYNTKVSLDIMGLLKTYTMDDIELLENDIAIAKSLDVDFITVYPEQNLIKKDNAIVQDFVQYMKNCMNKESDNYYIDLTKDGNGEECKIENNPSLVYRYIKSEYDYGYFKENILSYYENDFASAIHNIIAFGDKNCEQEVISYSPKRFLYAEKYEYDNPQYDIKYSIE